MVQNSEIALQEIPQYLEEIRFNETTGQLAVASSNLTGRDWDGAIAIFDDPKFAPNLPHVDFGSKLESGVKAVDWINEKKLVVATDAGTLEVFDLKEQPALENSLRFIEHGDMCSTISVNNQTKQLLSGSYDTLIKIWDLEVDVSINTFQLHSETVNKLKWNQHTNNVFCSVSEDQTALMYDNRKDEKPGMLVAKTEIHFPTCLEWLSSDKIVIGLSNGSIVCYDLRNTCTELCSTKKHRNYVTSIVANDSILLTGADDCFVYGLDRKTLDVVYKDNRHSDYIKCVTINPKDNTIWSCGWAGQIFNHIVGK
jgi:FOG: WD40 repeat